MSPGFMAFTAAARSPMQSFRERDLPLNHGRNRRRDRLERCKAAAAPPSSVNSCLVIR
jgi:hypothetical protein